MSSTKNMPLVPLPNKRPQTAFPKVNCMKREHLWIDLTQGRQGDDCIDYDLTRISITNLKE